MRQKFTLAVLSLVSLCTTGIAQGEARYNTLSFDVSVEQEIANDQAVATLSKSVSAKTAKELANKINPVINEALAIVKRYPSVQVATGSQHAYPEYNKGKITGFTGSASIRLQSQDTEALSSLLAELQNILVLESLTFLVSDSLNETTTANLKTQATQKFQAEAQSMVKAWGASSYRLVNAQMNNAAPHYHSKSYAYDAMPVMEMASAAKQTLEAGSSTIRYTINGTIELIY